VQVLGSSIEPLTPPGWPGTYVPNFSDWTLGDIVLVEGTGVTGNAIQLGQTISTNAAMRAGSQWSHAAVYVGNGDVVDATLAAGIQSRSVWNYCQSRAVTIRRITDPSIPSMDIAEIATKARSHIGQPYSIMQPLLAKLGWLGAQTPNNNALYCSTLVGLVVAEATGIELGSIPQWQPLYPAMLAMHSDLSTVPLEWRQF
jgi:uncharacterized protein YycO